MKKNSSDIIKTALIELYLTLRQYSLDIKSIKKEESSEYLLSMNELELIKYIKDSIDTVVLTLKDSYYNMYDIIKDHMEIVDIAVNATKDK